MLKWYVLVRKWLRSGRNRIVIRKGVMLNALRRGMAGLAEEDEDRRRRVMVSARLLSARAAKRAWCSSRWRWPLRMARLAGLSSTLRPVLHRISIGYLQIRLSRCNR